MIDLETFTKVRREDCSFEEWKDLINKNIKYAQEESTIFDFIGKCKPTDLPSYHPYWENSVKQRDLKYLLRNIEKYIECVKNPEMIKYHYNNSTQLEDIEERIKRDIKSVKTLKFYE